MKRRRFIAMTGGSIGLVGVGAAGGLWLLCPGPSTVGTAAAQIDEIARSMTGAASAGRAWLSANPDAQPRDRILEALELEPGTEIDRDALIASLAERVELEFAKDLIHEHDSWMLSQTETNLAALHVSLMGNLASEGSEPSFETAPEAELVSLERFDPQAVVQGEPISHPNLPENVIWFATAAAPPPRFRVFMDGASMPINANASGFSVQVPDSLRYQMFERPGEHPIWLYDPVVNRRQKLGTFTVRPAVAQTEGFCEVEAWGPQQTTAGSTFNEQPDGASAFWIRIGCFPASTVVTLAGVEVATTLRPADRLITTHIEDHDLYREPGRYPVMLMDSETGRTRMVGELLVTP